MKRCSYSLLYSLPILLSLCMTSLYANPKGMRVEKGAASIQNIDASSMEIKTDAFTKLKWDSFSIDKGEKTSFVMPTADSVVFNKVVGSDISSIMGTLQANGKVYLINPQGIIIGKEGVINTNGFVATTFDIIGDKLFSPQGSHLKGESNGSVINEGRVNSGSSIFFFAKEVVNKGELKASKGTVSLNAGMEFFLKEEKDNFLIKPILSVSEKEGTDNGSQDKEDLSIGVLNTGKIEAEKILMQADGNLYALAIKDAGKCEATASLQRGGEIFLVAEKGYVEETGSLRAKGADGKGGKIHLLGQDVVIKDQAYIDVSNDRGEGEILIGGDFQGKNPDIMNARSIWVGKDVQLLANSETDGPGGRVILWSDRGTYFSGKVFAKGGVIAGDGGFCEISSKGLLGYEGDVLLTATNGFSGRLLLDPDVLTISTSGSSGGWSPPAPPGTYDFFPTSFPANVNNTSLSNTLQGGVTVDLYADDIYVNAPVSWTSSSALKFSCDQVFVNADITSNYAGVAPVVDIIEFNAISLMQVGDGTQTNDIEISSNKGNIAISLFAFLPQKTAGLLYLQAGQQPSPPPATSSSATIETTQGAINIDAGAVLLEGGTGLNSVAQISGYGPSGINVLIYNVEGGSGQDNSVRLLGGSCAENGALCYALMDTAAGDFTIYARPELGTPMLGDIELKGGSGYTSYAQIITDQGNISINDIRLEKSGQILLQAGTSSDSSAVIGTNIGGNIVINQQKDGQSIATPYFHVNANATSADSYALIRTINGGDIKINQYVNDGSTQEIRLEAGLGSNSYAAIQTENGGNVQINNSLTTTPPTDVTILGGRSSSGSLPGPSGGSSGIYVATASSSGSIDINADTLKLQSELLSAPTGFNPTEIAVVNGSGNITIDANTIKLFGGAGQESYASIYTEGGGYIDVTNAEEMEIFGGIGNKSFANFESRNGGYIHINKTLSNPENIIRILGGKASLTGDAGILSSTQSGTGEIEIHAQQIDIEGGGNAIGSNVAEINSNNGSGDITVYVNDYIHLTGGTGQASYASIITENGQNISVTSYGSDSDAIQLFGGDAAFGQASFETQTGGNISINPNVSNPTSGISILGGNSATAALLGPDAGSAGFYVAENSGGGKIDIRATSLSMLGGTGTGFNPAEIIINQGIDDITIQLSGDLSLSGNTVTGDSFATILNKGSGKVIIGATDDKIGALTLTGGENGKSYANVSALGTADTSSVSIYAKSLRLNSGSTTSPDTSAYISTNSGATSGGALNMDISSSIYLSSKGVGEAYIQTEGKGNIQAQGPISLVVAGTGKAYISNTTSSTTPLNGYLTVQSGESVNLLGGSGTAEITTSLNNPSDINNLLVIADKNVVIGNNGNVENLGGGSVAIVVDNAYPVSPEIGSGRFFLGSTGTVTGGAVRIFTAYRKFDSINNVINGVAYVPGPDGVDTNQEQWGEYYPNSFFGGPGFTLFYKSPRAIEKDLLDRINFASSELFYILDRTYIDFRMLDPCERMIKKTKKFSIRVKTEKEEKKSKRDRSYLMSIFPL